MNSGMELHFFVRIIVHSSGKYLEKKKPVIIIRKKKPKNETTFLSLAQSALAGHYCNLIGSLSQTLPPHLFTLRPQQDSVVAATQPIFRMHCVWYARSTVAWGGGGTPDQTQDGSHAPAPKSIYNSIPEIPPCVPGDAVDARGQRFWSSLLLLALLLSRRELYCPEWGAVGGISFEAG